MRSRREPVPNAPDSFEMPWLRRRLLDLLAQAPDVHRDRSGVEGCRIPPHAIHQLVAGEDAPRMRDEEPEEVELLEGQLQWLVVSANLSRRSVDFHRAEPDHLRPALAHGRRAAQ